jgi:hypothetical protein
MTAAARKIAARPSALEVFVARAEAKAMLWAAGEISLHDAVDELWADAVRDGLTAKLGVDEVQQLLADAFAPEREDLPQHADVVVPDELVIDGERIAAVPIATLKAGEYLLRLGDRERFAKWFDRHTAQERAAILQHLEARTTRRGT